MSAGRASSGVIQAAGGRIVTGMGTKDADAAGANGAPASEMTDEQKRRDQLTAAPNATEEDARPRIEVTERDGVTRIDIAEDAPVRPGDPTNAPDGD